MNNEIVINNASLKASEVKIDKNNPQKSIKQLLKKKSEIKKDILKECDSKEIDPIDLKDTYNSMCDLLEQHNMESNRVNLKNFTKKEKSIRAKQHNISKNTFAEFCSDSAIRNILFNSVCSISETRAADAFILQMADNYEDVIKYGKAFDDLKKGIDKENNKKVITSFFNEKYKKCKEVVEYLSTIKSEEDLDKYINKNILTITTIGELQSGYLARLGKELEIDIPKEEINEWDKYYSFHAISTANFKLLMQSKANPLYKEIDAPDCMDICNLLNDNRDKLPDEMQDSLLFEDSTKKLNPLSGMFKSMSLYGHPKNTKNSNGTPDFTLGKMTVKNNIILKLHLDYPDIKFEDCLFHDENNRVVKMDEALNDICSGRTYRLTDSSNNQLLKLNVDYDKYSFFLTDSFDKEKINSNEIVNKYKKVLNDSKETLKNSNNKEKALETISNKKKEFNKEVNDDLKKSLKSLLNDVKKEAPWYRRKRSNPQMYELKSKLKDILNSDFNDRTNLKNKLKGIKEYTKQALSLNNEIRTTPQKNENILMKISATLVNSDKLIENIDKLDREFNTTSNIPKISKIIESKKIEIVDKDLEIDTSLNKSIVKEDAVIEKDDLIIETIQK